MTEREKLNQITEAKDNIDVGVEPVFDEGYHIGYIHGVNDALDMMLDIIDMELSMIRRDDGVPSESERLISKIKKTVLIFRAIK